MQVSVPVETMGTFTQQELPAAAQTLIQRARTYPVWLFYGEMGAGKTTFIKSICEKFGVTDAMSSPTFSIVNEYEASEGRPVYHFDFYRLRHEAEAFDIGTEEYFYSGYPCLVEWPEKIPSLIPDRVGEVTITVENETLRTIAVQIR